MTSLILASASKIRGELLKNAGLTFKTDPAQVDERELEKPLLEANASPEGLAAALARAKALEVSSRNEGSMVIGADQILAFEGNRLTKPENMAAARSQLEKFSGKSHRLYSAVCVVRNGETLWETVTYADLHVRDLSANFLDWYLEAAGNDILSSVGAYQLEAVGLQLFEKIEGDYFTILGLPLLPLLSFLRQNEVVLP
ncbi:Maf family nucleotide pyrophosphatase [Flexibacterium corallicola]|uniref:Maf family nucleotide pyrophosphatase n=1 Tax=Flexibacterium corallicola TaxID=3037259 RepID=UPI00286EBA0F|nr:Maf family nucleotide pyrophosphatase [Pseudovibrio sp. M1P-2-3]